MELVTIEKNELAELVRDIVAEEIGNTLNPLTDLIVLQQKDAAKVKGVSVDMIRGKAKRGEMDILQRDGSRLNYLTLTQVNGLKPRKRTAK